MNVPVGWLLPAKSEFQRIASAATHSVAVSKSAMTSEAGADPRRDQDVRLAVPGLCVSIQAAVLWSLCSCLVMDG